MFTPRTSVHTHTDTQNSHSCQHEKKVKKTGIISPEEEKSLNGTEYMKDCIEKMPLAFCHCYSQMKNNLNNNKEIKIFPNHEGC